MMDAAQLSPTVWNVTIIGTQWSLTIGSNIPEFHLFVEAS
jgi:hypothetical protein